ncbi:hypothetical protein J0H58_36815 [bacterium]|nr:hypothetical protein [bacterium]
MNRERIPQIESFVETLNGWRGMLVEVTERLTRSPGTLDRHVTTRSALVMRLENVGVAFSGATLVLFGQVFGRNVEYQATLDLLENLTVRPEEVVFVERFGTVAERHSTFRPLPEPQDG